MVGRSEWGGGWCEGKEREGVLNVGCEYGDKLGCVFVSQLQTDEETGSGSTLQPSN